MKKLFCSQPFSNKTEYELKYERYGALVTLQTIFGIDLSNFEIIDNYHHPEIPENAGRLMRLGRRLMRLGGGIQQMADADLVYFCKGWESSKECQIEKDICKTYGIPYIVYPHNQL